VSALVATRPAGGRSYDAPEFEPLWAAAEDLGLPLALHVGANRPGPGDPFGRAAVRRSEMASYDHWVRIALGDLILGGALERHPRLRVGSIEHELGWIPHWLERLDYAYTQKVRRADEHRFRGGALPSDFFRRGCFASFQEDALGIQLRDRIGVENLLWGSDYPHVESTFPRSREILEDVLAPCSEAERRAIVCENALRVYRLEGEQPGGPGRPKAKARRG
jgi:predicted TIM-barrel fold metal-dependent hydrolase